jgi:hypothetical protein
MAGDAAVLLEATDAPAAGAIFPGVRGTAAKATEEVSALTTASLIAHTQLRDVIVPLLPLRRSPANIHLWHRDNDTCRLSNIAAYSVCADKKPVAAKRSSLGIPFVSTLRRRPNV